MFLFQWSILNQGMILYFLLYYNYASKFCYVHQIISEDMEEESLKTPSEHSTLVGLNDPPDESFGLSEPLDYDRSETGWQSDYDHSRLGDSTWHIITKFQVIGSQLISEEPDEITFPQY